MAHLAACSFALIADSGPQPGWGAQTWVADYFNDGHALRHAEDDDGPATAGSFPRPWRLYVVALYWAFTTLTTVGYGDVKPVSDGEMFFTIFVQFAGTCCLGYVMGDVAAMLTREPPGRREPCATSNGRGREATVER